MKRLILLITFLVLFLAIFLPRFLINVKIDCRSQFGKCPPEIGDKVALSSGKKMYLAKNELNESLKTDFLVSAYSIHFKLPNILRVDVVVKQPVFALKNKDSAKFAQIDIQGTAISESDRTNLPYVITESTLPKAGEKASDKDFFALKLMDGVYKMFQVRSGVVSNDALLVDIPGGVRVIFPLVDADREILLGSLKLIYSSIRNNENSTLYSEIDLRYKNPVLR